MAEHYQHPPLLAPAPALAVTFWVCPKVAALVLCGCRSCPRPWPCNRDGTGCYQADIPSPGKLGRKNLSVSTAFSPDCTPGVTVTWYQRPGPFSLRQEAHGGNPGWESQPEHFVGPSQTSALDTTLTAHQHHLSPPPATPPVCCHAGKLGLDVFGVPSSRNRSGIPWFYKHPSNSSGMDRGSTAGHRAQQRDQHTVLGLLRAQLPVPARPSRSRRCPRSVSGAVPSAPPGPARPGPARPGTPGR